MVDVSDIVGDDALTTFLDLSGIIVGSLLGAKAAAEERFDVVGVLALSLACGLGGGVIRDVLISAGPPLALLRPAYLATALAGAFIVLAIDVPGSRLGSRVLLVGDALLLGFLTAAGAQRAAIAGLAPLSVGLLGVITAIGGGMMRDVLIGRAPSVLRRGPLYASVAIVAATTYAVLDAMGVPVGWTVLACVVVGFALRMSAIRWGIELPDEPQPLQRVVRRKRRAPEGERHLD